MKLIKSMRVVDNSCKLEIQLPSRLFELEAPSEIEAQEWLTKIHFATKETDLNISQEF